MPADNDSDESKTDSSSRIGDNARQRAISTDQGRKPGEGAGESPGNITAGVGRYIGNGAENYVYGLDENRVLKLVHTLFQHSFSEEGGEVFVALDAIAVTPSELENRVKIINALNGAFSRIITLPSGESAIVQERLSTGIGDTEYTDYLDSLGLVSATTGATNQFIFDLEGTAYLVSDVTRSNVGKRKDGSLALFDLIATEIPPETLKRIAGKMPISSGNVSSL